MWENVVYWCNTYLHISPKWKVMYYILSLCIFSMLKETHPSHLDILTGKHSILNQVFVKLGWLWTSSIFALYGLLSLSIHKKPFPILGRLCVRYVVTTLIFYIWCAVIFPMVESYTGACLHKRIQVFDITKRECLKRRGYEYDSFDISGHSYLMTYCVLILMEESKESLYFLQLSRYLRKAEIPVKDSDHPLLDRNEAAQLETNFNVMRPIILISYLAVFFLCILWDFMLIITTIYYHTFSEKVLGSILAMCMWYLLYNFIFSKKL
ncbi:acyl-coenzyme A diphosphatase FITM2-like [Palaemon carinicauda]|uniref:acyl-coenzyme A diphosphatase FITM2-like n=1 Tax=Palaemon carinicauda TaxID=392227 RepID=UPI0035B65EE7